MKQKTGMRLAGLLLLFFLLSCSRNAAELVREYEANYNSRQAKKVAEMFQSDGTVEVSGQFLLQGKEYIRDLASYDSVLNTGITISNLRWRDDTVYCDLSQTNDWLKVSEIGRADYTAEFILEDGLIKSLRLRPAPETEKAFKEVYAKLFGWARADRPYAILEIMPEGEFVYNARNAKKTLALVRSWKAVTN